MAFTPDRSISRLKIIKSGKPLVPAKYRLASAALIPFTPVPLITPIDAIGKFRIGHIKYALRSSPFQTLIPAVTDSQFKSRSKNGTACCLCLLYEKKSNFCTTMSLFTPTTYY